jgi:hypothetical protein
MTSCGMNTCSHLNRDKWEERLCVPWIRSASYRKQRKLKNAHLDNTKHRVNQGRNNHKLDHDKPALLHLLEIAVSGTLAKNGWSHAGSCVLQRDKDRQRRGASAASTLQLQCQNHICAAEAAAALKYGSSLQSSPAYSQSICVQRLLLGAWASWRRLAK